MIPEQDLVLHVENIQSPAQIRCALVSGLLSQLACFGCPRIRPTGARGYSSGATRYIPKTKIPVTGGASQGSRLPDLPSPSAIMQFCDVNIKPHIKDVS